MKKVLLALTIVLVVVSCQTLKRVNYVTKCAEVGTLVEVSRFGHYKINNKPVADTTALRVCKEIAYRQMKANQ